MTEVSCSCCEIAFMLFHMINRRICANFMYQRSGLNVDISIDESIISSMSVTNYMPFKLCSMVPGSIYSNICLNILELNIFPRSITICPRLEFMSKNQRWIINYTCISISTILPDEKMPLISMNTPMMGMKPSYRPQSLQTQTPSPSNQMQSSLNVKPPNPMTSKPSQSPAPGQTITTKSKPTSPLTMTTIKPKPMSTPSTAKPTSTVQMEAKPSSSTGPPPNGQMISAKPTTGPISVTKPGATSTNKTDTTKPGPTTTHQTSPMMSPGSTPSTKMYSTESPKQIKL
ncbi:salivary glue protein Sgs-3-like isoform X2 [Microplitis mediator]|nr:salivary glue protein Sgs-3-like isoform X2 [Microplitis mediator]